MRHRFLFALAACLLSIPATAEPFPIAPYAIEAAVAQAAGGVPLQDLRVLAPAVAGEREPALAADQVRVDPFRRWLQVRVRCRTAGVCVPFYVVASLDGASFATKSVPADDHRPVFLVQRNQPAILVLQSSYARITLPVVCLQDGTRGQTVRVRASNGRLYVAEVLGFNQLHGRL
jgi:hypothetical protein